MRRIFRSSMLAALVMVALLLGFARGAVASPLSQTFPVVKQPTSAHFDLTGFIKSNDTQLDYIGDGAFVGTDRLEENISLKVPTTPGASTPGAPSSISVSVKVIGTKAYLKVSGLGTADDDKWYVTDTAAMGGMQGGLTGLGGSNPTGIDPKYADALNTQMVGTEIVNGVSTTKYQTNVDLQKLYGLMGSQVPAEFVQGTSLMLLTWIGTDDQYLHKFSMVMNSNLSTAGSPPSTLSMELTYIFKDFDTAITIDEPTGALPLDVPANSGNSSMMPLGLPIALLTGVTSVTSSPPAAPEPAPVTAPTGMPRTGSPDSGNTLLLPLVAALLCVGLGLALRRRAVLR